VSVVTVLSEKKPQNGQKERSSHNFTTANFPENVKLEDTRLSFMVFYDYGTANQRSDSKISFDIKVDKTGKDPTFLRGVRSGFLQPNTHHRSLYIANPKNAEKSFTVLITIDYPKNPRLRMPFGISLNKTQG